MSLQKHFTGDGGREIDWGRTSDDYSEHRPDYPDAFYERLAEQNIGLPGQRILDLGTGVGFLAQRFAQAGAEVVGIDIAAGQLEVARRRAAEAELRIDYQVASAEETHQQDNYFDVVTASQCWLYFDKPRATAEAKRVLRSNGLLAISHLCWLADKSSIARQAEELVLRYNPDWSGAGFTGEIPTEVPEYFDGHFQQIDLIVFDADLPFTRESWCGRWRACRGVGATLSPEKIAAFDRDHADILESIAGKQFTIPHRIDCRILQRL